MRNPRKTYQARTLAAFTLAAVALLGVGAPAAFATSGAPDSPGGSGAAPTSQAPHLAAPPNPAVELQLLGINDFHGRLEAAPQQNIAGAAVLAGAVSALRAQNPNTVFVSAGDNVGATTFPSFIANDEPTIRALAAAGLEVSAVGNHEFDQGYEDLTGRIIPSYGNPNFGLGANVQIAATGAPALPEYAIVERAGLKIGFIGVVTEDTATAVTAEFVRGLVFEDQLQVASETAERLTNDEGVDVTVVLTHDGSSSQDCATIAAENSTFGNLVRGLQGKADAIISGHTHNTYACVIDGMPVVSSGFYGAALGQVVLAVDPDTGDIQSSRAAIIPLIEKGAPAFQEDPTVTGIVAAAVAAAELEGTKPVGKISANILRGGTPSGSDRGVESALGNLIADIMHAKVPDADLAIVNPGSLRADLLHTGDGTLTYRDVASVQPFGNTLVAMTLTGAELRELLEAQWYVDGGAPLKRHLAISEGFSYTFTPSASSGSRIGILTLNGSPLAEADTVRVVTNAFLASGGDGFDTFTRGTNRVDTGYNDLQVTVEHFAAHSLVDPPSLGRAVTLDAPEPNPTPTPDPDPRPHPGPHPGSTPGVSEGAPGLASTGSNQVPFTTSALVLSVSLTVLASTLVIVAFRRNHRVRREVVARS